MVESDNPKMEQQDFRTRVKEENVTTSSRTTGESGREPVIPMLLKLLQSIYISRRHFQSHSATKHTHETNFYLCKDTNVLNKILAELIPEARKRICHHTGIQEFKAGSILIHLLVLFTTLIG